MKKIVCIVCFTFLAVLVGKAQNLTGTWALDKVQVEEVKKGRSLKKTDYSSNIDFAGKESYPEQLVIQDSEVVYMQLNGETVKTTYTQNLNVIRIDMIAFVESYTYEVAADGALILKTSYQRMDNNDAQVTSYTALGYYSRTK